MPERHATVWSSTWVPGSPPIPDADETDGYAVVWADADDGVRVQALVMGATRQPAIGSTGALGSIETWEGELPVFQPEEAR